MATITVTRNTQITIPKKIREQLGIKVGDKVEIDIEDEKVVVRTIKPSFAGYQDFLPRSFDQVLEKMRKDSTGRFKKLGVVL
ncbi:MAG: AbrB/MazE/SpoVT family DNA-binding domain-containing protein [Candidatus Hydrothermarchaeaceae archaeon]